MYFNTYINPEFTHYINRYCNGIILFNDALKRVSMSYGLSDAFSNHACRFYLKVEFIDFDSLSSEDKMKARHCFYNSSNTSGSEFVSFVYKHQHGFETDINEIKAFIFHYQFAQELFEGFVKKILPETCILKIKPLDETPFFNYIRDFIWHKENNKDEKFSLRKTYEEIMKSDFDLDCAYHNTLIENSEKSNSYERDDIVTDKELVEAGAAGIGGLSDIRRFVIEYKVKFYVKYHPLVIREIEINRIDLEQKLTGYNPENSYRDIKPAIISKLLQQKAKQHTAKELLKKEKQEQIGIEEGDYVYVHKIEWGKEIKEVGVIKKIELNYKDDIWINYNKLNNDLSESKLALKQASTSEIFSVINANIFREASLKSKLQAMKFFIDKGNRNKFFKLKK
jgi:hypothetical protein